MASEPAMKTFSLHWGSGVVEEEAQIETPYHRPTILKFTTGKAKGSYEIRFCTYDHSVASAPEGSWRSGVRVWQITSRAGGHAGGDGRRRVLMLPTLRLVPPPTR